MTVGEYIEVLKRFDPSLPLIDRHQFHRDGHFQFVGVGDPLPTEVVLEHENEGGARIYRFAREGEMTISTLMLR